jgi:peptidoglycan/xylan/chitin deacetylase (PgdA/CDA1 family)
MFNPAVEITRRYSRALPGIHRALSRRFPRALWSGDASRREVALTFDDGPHAKDTPALLRVLARHDVRATFFHNGQPLANHPALAREVAAAGHQLALHGYFHRPFLHQALSAFVQELADEQRLLAEATGLPTHALRDVRPPYGVFTPHALSALWGANFRPVMWSVVPFHWRQTMGEALAEVERLLAPGAIIVLHEAMTTGPDVAVLADEVIRRVKDAGLSFVTVDEMWHVNQQPG